MSREALRNVARDLDLSPSTANLRDLTRQAVTHFPLFRVSRLRYLAQRDFR